MARIIIRWVAVLRGGDFHAITPNGGSESKEGNEMKKRRRKYALLSIYLSIYLSIRMLFHVIFAVFYAFLSVGKCLKNVFKWHTFSLHLKIAFFIIIMYHLKIGNFLV